MQRAFLLPFPIMNHPQQKYAFQSIYIYLYIWVCVQVKVYYTVLHKLALTLAGS